MGARHRPWLGMGLLVLTALVGACGGGSSDGGVVDPGPTVAADFIPEESLPPSQSVALARGTVSKDLVTVKVTIRNVSQIYGVAFDLRYDGSMAEYKGFTKGEVLETGGVSGTYQIASPMSGQVVVGATRNGNVPAVSVTGTKALLYLTFRVKKAGINPLGLVDPILYDGQAPPVPVNGIDWFAGTLKGD